MYERALRAAHDAMGGGQSAAALAHLEVAFRASLEAGAISEMTDVLRRIGAVRTELGELELAAEMFELSLAIAEAHGLKDRVAFALICMASNEQRGGELNRATELYARANSLATDIGDSRISAMVAQNMGAIANIRGDVQLAIEQYRFALECSEQNGDEHTAALALHNMGMAYVDIRRWSDAARCFDAATVLADRINDLGLLASVELNRAELYVRSGSDTTACQCCDLARSMFARLGSSSGLAEVEKLSGLLARGVDDADAATRHIDRALVLARSCGDRLLEAEALSERAILHLSAEENREALQCLNTAHRTFSELHARREILDLDKRLDGLEATYLSVVRAWGESIESKDAYTAGHCERVANYACMLAAAVGFEGRDLTWMRMGGYLHDVGKIAVPLEILNKPGRLTDEEFRIIQTHPAEGDAIVAELNFPWDIRPIVRWHHERWGGGGYPDGLVGEEIPLTARVLCIADVYDALTSARSYRGAMTMTDALAVMANDSGSHFEPRLFEIFRELLIHRAPTAPDERFPAYDRGPLVAA